MPPLHDYTGSGGKLNYVTVRIQTRPEISFTLALKLDLRLALLRVSSALLGVSSALLRVGCVTVNREALTVKSVPAGDALFGGGAGENAMLSRRVVGQGGA